MEVRGERRSPEVESQLHWGDGLLSPSQGGAEGAPVSLQRLGAPRPPYLYSSTTRFPLQALGLLWAPDVRVHKKCI